MSNRRHSPTEDQYYCPIEDKDHCPTEDKGYCQRKTNVNTKSHTLTEPIPSNTHLIERGSQTACNRKLDYHDNCTLYRG
jgi:hypothetical protein